MGRTETNNLKFQLGKVAEKLWKLDRLVEVIKQFIFFRNHFLTEFTWITLHANEEN